MTEYGCLQFFANLENGPLGAAQKNSYLLWLFVGHVDVDFDFSNLGSQTTDVNITFAGVAVGEGKMNNFTLLKETNMPLWCAPALVGAV